MKKIITIASAVVLSVTALGATLAPASAAPYQQHYSGNNQQHPKFESHGDYAYYNGQKGFKHRHAGYREYNGYWFPPAAFVVGGLIFGTILGGIIASQHHH